MKLASLRLIVAPLFATAVCLAVSSHTDAARYERTFAEQLVATAVSAPDAGAVAGGRLHIAIERWATDEESERLRPTLTHKEPFTGLAKRRKKFRRARGVQ